MNSYFVQFSIPRYQIVQADHKEYVNRRVEYLKQDAAIEIFKKIESFGCPVVLDSHLETWESYEMDAIVYRLHYRLEKVRTMNVTMAVMEPLTFTNHAGVVEWKCPACGTINSIEATVCGEKHDRAIGCGRPREKTRQEM